MKIVWLVVGVIYLVLADFYFYLAFKSRRKVVLKNLQIDKLPLEPFLPKGKDNVLEGSENGTVRSASSKPIIEYANYLGENVQQHLNQFIFPSVKEYLDETSRINTKGFIVAGVLSLIATSVAFCSAFFIL